MRHILRTTILFLCLLACGVANADQPTVGDQRMFDKLERTRQLMQETPAPTEASAAAQSVQDAETTSSGMKMVQSLGFLVALVLVSAWAYKKFVLKEAVTLSRKMKLIERLPIAPRASLMLAEIDGTTILVGLSGDAISLMKLEKPQIPFAVTLDEEYKGE